MSEQITSSRRKFLQTTAVIGGGLVIGFHLPAFAKKIRNIGVPAAENFAPNAFVRIGKDNIITVIVNHSEMGQGAYTSLPMIIADELDADWSKVKFEAAPVDPVYNHPGFGMQGTGGSTSTWVEWDRFRNAGATGRFLLVAAAAQTWNVDASTLRTEKGFVIHDATSRKLSYGELVDKAATITAPKEVKLKDAKDFKFIGKPVKRLDTPEKIDGSGIFGLDVKIPGLLTAVIARAPVFGGKVKSFNADKAKAIPGVKEVVQIDRGIAVVANGFWPAKLGRDALEIAWDEGALSTLDTKAQTKQYADLAKQSGAVAKKEGDVSAAKDKAVKKFDVVYDMPYLAHAPMEPLN